MGDRSLRLVRLGAGEDARAWHEALARPGWLREPTSLKEEGGAWVRRGLVRVGTQDRDVVAKCRPLRGASERAKCALGLGRGDRHWRGAGWLLAHGFRTARPLVLARSQPDGPPCEVLVMEALGGKSVLAHLADRDLTARQEHAVARELGRMIVRLSRLHRYNRDCKPSNLIVSRVDGRSAEVAMIDTVAIRRAARRGAQGQAMMFAAMVIEPIGTGCSPRRTLMARVLCEALAEEERSRAEQFVDPRQR
jgi:hypothetical protein